MSSIDKKSNQTNQYETSFFYPFGWVLIFIASIPVMIGIKDNKSALSIGIIIAVVGVVLLIIGKINDTLKNKKKNSN